MCHSLRQHRRPTICYRTWTKAGAKLTRCTKDLCQLRIRSGEELQRTTRPPPGTPHRRLTLPRNPQDLPRPGQVATSSDGGGVGKASMAVWAVAVRRVQVQSTAI
ncbi:uncharacterized protein LOC128092813 isoform X1 [Culex pipiens pallens]|uniref:uncharacterized protein LOC128092813 isoform X1 n=1 Tax=Culex pipiens pallens TaxID=42434 RepID=UPI0022AB46BF|nr:uncharacterized protein LOC128092813 isoform X1 [Culex pipiens pallens]